MFNIRQVRRIGLAAVLAGVPLLQASAQTTAPTSPTTPAPTAPGASPPAATPAPATPRSDKSATAPGKAKSLVGLAVFSADGSKIGTVHSVGMGADGNPTAIRIKTGGFLGFGAKLVSIPQSKFSQTGDSIRLGMTADEVSKLPEVREQS